MTPTSVTPARVGLVAVGALAGSGIRYLSTSHATGVPWAVLWVNLAGAVLAGYLVARVRRHAHHARVLLPLAVVGVAGALTTFSGVVVDGVLLADAGDWAAAVRYASASVVLGPIAAAAGIAAGRLR